MQVNQNNGVRSRIDGQGDGWALAHRDLGPTFNMHDVDAMFGVCAFGQNTGEKLFLEYVPDNYQNRFKTIRKFGYVALFDRKSSMQALMAERNKLSTAFYLSLCRTLGLSQPVMPKFFYVIGGQEPPWIIREVDIETGELLDNVAELHNAGNNDWRRVWKCLGLIELRETIRKWVDPS